MKGDYFTEAEFHAWLDENKGEAINVTIVRPANKQLALTALLAGLAGDKLAQRFCLTVDEAALRRGDKCLACLKEQLGEPGAIVVAWDKREAEAPHWITCQVCDACAAAKTDLQLTEIFSARTGARDSKIFLPGQVHAPHGTRQ